MQTRPPSTNVRETNKKARSAALKKEKEAKDSAAKQKKEAEEKAKEDAMKAKKAAREAKRKEVFLFDLSFRYLVLVFPTSLSTI